MRGVCATKRSWAKAGSWELGAGRGVAAIAGGQRRMGGSDSVAQNPEVQLGQRSNGASTVQREPGIGEEEGWVFVFSPQFRSVQNTVGAAQEKSIGGLMEEKSGGESAWEE